MEIKDFTEKVFEKFNKQMTDEIFYFIENDRELLHDYLLLLNKHELNVLNSNIAKRIKEKYSLKSIEVSKEETKSKLIQSYTKFEK